MTRINANNHAGWEVQQLRSTGWTSLHPSSPFATIEQAEAYMSILESKSSGWEYRCYEALHMKEQA